MTSASTPLNAIDFPEEDLTHVIQYIKTALKGESFDVDQIFYLVPRLMQLVESFKTISGVQKKAVIVKALLVVADEVISSDLSYKENVLQVISNTVPIFIDTLVSVDKRELRIKITSWVNWFRELIQCTCCLSNEDKNQMDLK